MLRIQPQRVPAPVQEPTGEPDNFRIIKGRVGEGEEAVAPAAGDLGQPTAVAALLEAEEALERLHMAVRCWRGVPSDRGPLKACAEAGKRGSALLHAWRLEQNRVPPSCGRSFRPTVYGRSHGTRRHGVWAQACCRRRCARGGGGHRGGGGGTLRRPRAAELRP